MELEEKIAHFKNVEACVVFQSGFTANAGTVSSILGKEDIILSDELNHASIIDGCRLSRSQLSVYRHNDMEHLSELLAAGSGAAAPMVVVTDTVFSMDGDTAPVEEITALCRRHGALLLVDEAHAVLGPHLPLAACAPSAEPTVVRVGTLSKMLGSMGGFVCGPQGVIDLLVNRARPYIFSTALTPADAAAALAALAVVRAPEGDALVARLSALVARVADAGLAASGHPSPIIPIVLGTEQRALAASTALLADGLWVPAIRPPTVPAGTSRLRVTLSAAHGDDDVERLIASVSWRRGMATAAAARPPGH
jgi:8-amino-7-oxononanoate synthase